MNQLAQAAQAAMQSGRLEESAALWAHVLALAPSHPFALFHLGQHELHRGDAAAARDYFRRAMAVAPGEPELALNLSFACRAMRDVPGESAAIAQALAIDAYYYPALMAKAGLLERQGQRRLAARTYADVLKIVPPVEHVPMELRSQLEHAQAMVDENAQTLTAFLNDRLSEIRNRLGGADFSRLDACRDALTGRARIYTQKPTMLHFPGLPAIQYYDNADFEWLREVESGTQAIRDELEALLASQAQGFAPYVQHPAGAPLNQWAELNHSPRWSAYFLWKDGRRVENRCPRTAEILSHAPLCDMKNFAPTVFFSTLDPHTRIPPHSGDSNARLIVHLPLVVPGQCYFRVGNETREWKVGHAWIFDDTIEHEAWNDSDKLRVILIFDIWNPYLTVAERALVGELLNASNDYYRENG